MIKNDRQYRVSKARVRTFEQSISRLEHEHESEDIDSQFTELQIQALSSQLKELITELKEYEYLKSGKPRYFEAESTTELPILLIKARIAAGMTHRMLADRLKVKEQQVQRWESNEYIGASLETIRTVAEALGVGIRQELYLPSDRMTTGSFLKFLVRSGMSQEFVLNRLLPRPLASLFRQRHGAGLREILDAASNISRIFGVSVSDIVTMKHPLLSLSGVSSPRFKLPLRTNPAIVNAYTIYAHYLAAILVDCVPEHAKNRFPNTTHEFHVELSSAQNPINFEKALELIWDCGVILLPLRDSGAFHGAVWKIANRFVIVLKQTALLESRWLYDLLHEVGHIRMGHITDDIALIEERPICPDLHGGDEEAANEWAENVLFDGQSEELEKACEKASGGNLKRLKSVLPNVAEQFNVNLGALANHMAYRLQQQDINWWGAANNVQDTDKQPYEIARNILLKRIDLEQLNTLDRELLVRSISEV